MGLFFDIRRYKKAVDKCEVDTERLKTEYEYQKNRILNNTWWSSSNLHSDSIKNEAYTKMQLFGKGTYDDLKARQEDDKFLGTLAFGSIGAILGFVSGLASFSELTSRMRENAVRENQEIIDAKVSEYSTQKVAELKEAYPVLDVTPDNLAGQIESAYDNCWAPGHRGVIVKPGWENFYVDYRRGNIDVAGDIRGIEDGIIDMGDINFDGTLMGVGVGAMVFATITLIPVIRTKIMFHTLNNTLATAEAKEKEKELADAEMDYLRELRAKDNSEIRYDSTADWRFEFVYPEATANSQCEQQKE